MSNATRAFQELIDQAKARQWVATSDEKRLELAMGRGEPIPDICKPGYLLTRMNEKDREAIQGLTSDETKGHGLMDVNAEREFIVEYERKRANQR